MTSYLNTNHKLSAALLLCAVAAVPAYASEVYVPMGFPGIGIGYAHPLNETFAVRADLMALGRRSENRKEEGITFQASAKGSRAALLVDAFPFAGTFRLTAGLVANDYKLSLDATGAGGTISLDGRDYITTARDGLRVQIKFPSTTPYLGIGWGHQTGSGWRFSADLGAAVGKAKLTATTRGEWVNQPDFQKNLDKELADLRDGVGKINMIPQVSFGVGYSF